MDDLIKRQAAITLLRYWSGGYDYIEISTEGADFETRIEEDEDHDSRPQV